MGAGRRWATGWAWLARVAAVLVVAALPLAGAAAERESGGRVVNGRPVPADKYPFLVYVGKVGCTGSLIDAEWVLTAAHCVVTDGKVDPPRAFELVLFSPDKTKGRRAAVTKVVAHPDYYKGGELINDVALLRLAEPVAAAEAVRYPGKGETRFERAGRPVTMIGWGATDPKATNYPDRARQAPARVVDFKECKKAWGGLTPEVVCAGQPPRDICNGDSGGPLLADTPKGWVQIGVLSFGDEPCGAGLPAGYARLSAPIIADFIAQTVAGRPEAGR